VQNDGNVRSSRRSPLGLDRVVVVVYLRPGAVAPQFQAPAKSDQAITVIIPITVTIAIIAEKKEKGKKITHQTIISRSVDMCDL